MKLFVDDAKFKNTINNEQDVKTLQEDLYRLYCWQEKNNLKFNESKFQLLRYGPYEDIKENSLYFTANMDNVS